MTRPLASPVEARLAELAPLFGWRLRRLLEDCPWPVSITSGYRSTADQQRLYDAYLAGTGNPANRPGTSKHERREAADLSHAHTSAGAWCRANAGRYGLRYPYPHEPWHVERNSSPTPAPPAVPPRPSTTDEETLMALTAETVKQLTDALRPMVRAEAERVAVLLIRGDDPDRDGVDTHPDNLGRIRAELAELRAELAARPAT